MNVRNISARFVCVFLTACATGTLAAENPETPFDRFGCVYVSGSIIHMNDEGDPYRFGLGMGHSVWNDRVSLITDLVYSQPGGAGTKFSSEGNTFVRAG